MSNKPWSNQMSNNHHAVEQNQRGPFHGNRQAYQQGLRPTFNDGLHPAFRNDHERQNVYHRKMVNDYQNFSPNDRPFHQMSRHGYTHSPGSYPRASNQPHFLSPRHVGPGSPLNRPFQYRPRHAHQFNTKMQGQHLHSGNIHKYFKESMLEDPWKEFGQQEISQQNTTSIS